MLNEAVKALRELRELILDRSELSPERASVEYRAGWRQAMEHAAQITENKAKALEVNP
jgi:hypothetical protein